MITVDSKSIQNAATAKEKGYDAGKKSRVKLHLGVDVRGDRLKWNNRNDRVLL